MAQLAKIAVLIILNTAKTHTVLGLWCHKCISPLGWDLDCERHYEEHPPTYCLGSDVCGYHIIGKPSSEILHRDCFPETHCEDLALEYRNHPDADVMQCKVCNYDLCNSTSSLKSSGFLTCAFILFWIFLKTFLA